MADLQSKEEESSKNRLWRQHLKRALDEVRQRCPLPLRACLGSAVH